MEILLIQAERCLCLASTSPNFNKNKSLSQELLAQAFEQCLRPFLPEGESNALTILG